MKVLKIIFGYLNVPHLKICRQVCSAWNKFGTPRLLKLSLVCLDAEDPERIQWIENWMTSTCKNIFRNFTCYRSTHKSYPKIWSLLGPHVRCFIVSHWWGNSKDLRLTDIQDLILKRCPNLEELVIPSTAQFKNVRKFLVFAINPKTTVRTKLKVKTRFF